jgi:hypothetical protein
MKISRDKAIDLIKTNGLKQTVGVTHIKKEDGSLRTGSYRLGVKKNLTGKGLKYNPADYGLIPVYDMNKNYRMIWEDGIQQVTINKQVYDVE